MTAAAIIRHVKSTDQFGWALAVSLGLHLLVIAAIIVWPSGGQKRILFSPTYQVSLVAGPPLPAAPAAAPAARPTAAPAAATPAPPPKAEPKVAPKPQPKPKPEPKVAIGTKETAKRITRKKKAAEPDPDEILAQRLNRMQREVKQDKALEAALSKVESKVGGAASTTGGAYARPGGDEMSARFQLYYTEVWERIRRSWNLPEALTGNTRGRMAVVTLVIRRDGSLEKFWLEESSGNARLDQSALRAVEKAAPFPPLPGGYPRPTHEVGIRFRPDEAGG